MYLISTFLIELLHLQSFLIVIFVIIRYIFVYVIGEQC